MRGNIRRRAKDSWTIQVYLGKDAATGKKRYASRTARGSKKDAETALANLIRAQETGLDLAAAKLTVAAYLDRWLDVSKQRVKPRTHFRYAQLVRLHVKPAFGTAQLTKLRPLHIEELYGALHKGGTIRDDRPADPPDPSRGSGAGGEVAAAGPQSRRCRDRSSKGRSRSRLPEREGDTEASRRGPRHIGGAADTDRARDGDAPGRGSRTAMARRRPGRCDGPGATDASDHDGVRHPEVTPVVPDADVARVPRRDIATASEGSERAPAHAGSAGTSSTSSAIEATGCRSVRTRSRSSSGRSPRRLSSRSRSTASATRMLR